MFAALSCLLANGEEVAISVFVCTAVVGIATVIAHAARKTREAGYTARLKQLMIERGMSAQEIDLVIRSQPDSCGSPSLTRWHSDMRAK